MPASLRKIDNPFRKPVEGAIPQWILDILMPNDMDASIAAPMTTIGPNAVKLGDPQRYFKRIAEKVLPDIQKSGTPLESVVKSVRPRRLSGTHIDEDPRRYVGEMWADSSGAELAKTPGHGSDASLLEMTIDDLVKYFSGNKFDPFK